MSREFANISKGYLHACQKRLEELQQEEELLQAHITDISKIVLSAEFPNTYPNGIPATTKAPKVSKVSKPPKLGTKPKRKYTKRSKFWSKKK